MEFLRLISRILLGVVFVFSGFVKAVDPLGSTYKFTDYFNAFGLGFISSLALPLAILLSSAELLMGISLLLGYRMKVTSWAVILFMSFFTILTFILALTNPVTDCGCFGDALILTNWQTFGKNIVLMLFAGLLFMGRRKYQSITSAPIEWTVLGLFFTAIVLLSVYCLNNLPIIDFRHFSKGSNIPAGMIIPENAAVDIYETRLLYKNKSTGKQEIFSIENFPDDSLWEFVSQDSKLVSKGYEPPIHDFSITAPNGQDITDIVLKNPGYTFLLISYNLNKADHDGLLKADKLSKIAQSIDNIDFYALTASSGPDVHKLIDSLKLGYDFYNVDEIVLKTIIRANPGLLLIKNGTVLANWHYNNIPEPADLGPEFVKLLDMFPLAPGIDLNNLLLAPAGSRPDVFETSLTYRNLINDSIASFPMNNLPDPASWVFVKSESRKVLDGFSSALSDFSVITPQGEEISDNILRSQMNTFLVIAKEPHNINTDLLQRINILTTLTEGSPAIFYGLANLQSAQLRGFMDSFVTPVNYCTTPVSFIDKVAPSGISLVWLQQGNVCGIWKDDQIPSADAFRQILSKPAGKIDFETAILPYLFKSDRLIREKQTIFLFIFGFIAISLIVRIFLEESFRKGK